MPSRRAVLVALLFPLMLLVVALPATAQEEGEPAWLSVMSFRGSLPAGALEVRIDGEAAGRLDRLGFFETRVAPGEHTLVLRGEAGELLRRRLNAVAGDDIRVTVTIREDGEATAEVTAAGGSGAVMAETVAEPGRVTGRVVDSEEETPVVDARVLVRGTAAEARTDDQGRFELELPAGEQTLSVVHGDYATRSLSAVTVPAKDTAELGEVALTPAGLDLGEFVVTAPYVEGSVASAVAEQRDAGGVSEILGAEQMSQAGDSDAADALARVTGLTIEDGKYVVIRGQPSRYTKTLLNGSPLPSPDPMRRVVPLDLFPTGVLSAINVEKSYRASRPGTFGGGLIGLRTRGMPESDHLELSLGTGINTQSFGEEGFDYPGGGTDWLGVDDGTRSEPPDDLNGVDGSGMATGHAVDGRTLGPDRSFSLDAARRLETDYGDYGLVASLSYGDQTRYREEDWNNYSLSGGELQKNTSYTRSRSEREIGLGGLLTLGGEWGEDHQVRSNTFFMRSTTDSVRIAEGELSADYDQTRETQLSWNRRELRLQQFTGAHRFLDRLDLDWRLLTGSAERALPDRRSYTYNRLDDQWFIRSDAGMERTFNEVSDDITSSGVDLGLDLPAGGWLTSARLEGGVAASERDRSSSTRILAFLPEDGADITLGPDELFDPAGFGDRFRIRDDSRESDNYTGLQEVSALYAGVKLGVTEALEVELGSRQESVSMEVTPRGEATSGFDEDRSLPAASATLALGESMQVRAAMSSTYSLPLLTELAPIVYTDPDSGQPYRGNPDLVPVGIDSQELRWEWYPSEAETVTAGVFRKDYTDPIERSFADLAGGDRTLYQMRNFDSAEVTGVEIGTRLDLARRLGTPDGYYAVANASFVDSQVTSGGDVGVSQDRPLQGQADSVFNLQGGYDGERWNWTLAWNRVGERLAQVGIKLNEQIQLPDTYLQPVDYLDFTAGFEPSERLTFKFKARNLLDPELEYLQKGEPRRTYTKGRDFSLEAAWKF